MAAYYFDIECEKRGNISDEDTEIFIRNFSNGKNNEMIKNFVLCVKDYSDNNKRESWLGMHTRKNL